MSVNPTRLRRPGAASSRRAAGGSPQGPALAANGVVAAPQPVLRGSGAKLGPAGQADGDGPAWVPPGRPGGSGSGGATTPPGPPEGRGRGRRLLRLGAVLALVAVAAVAFVAVRDDGVDGVEVGVPNGTGLTPSGRIVVTEDGAVVDGMDVSGPIWVKADDVTITRSRVTFGGYHGIRIFSGAEGTVVEDTEINCESDHGLGIAFGRYTARRVEVNDCRRAFVTRAGHVTVVDSLADGEPVNFTVDEGRTSSVTATVPPTTAAPTTTAPPAAPATTAPPATAAPEATPSSPAWLPAESAIIDGAGPSNPGALRASGSITADKEGQVIENVKVSGTITVKANNVTIRNCEVRGFSTVAVVRTVSGVSGTRIEHCHLEATVGPDGAGSNGVVQGGDNIYVGHSEILGYADGIKAESGSTYENNYIHTYKPSGSEKHLDGIQGSGDSDFTVRNNVIDQPIDAGGNSAIFVQEYNGQQNYNISGVVIEGNYLRGGNFTVFMMGESYISDFTYKNNRFARDGNRYGYSRVTNCGAVDASNNLFKDDGSSVPGTC